MWVLHDAIRIHRSSVVYSDRYSNQQVQLVNMMEQGLVVPVSLDTGGNGNGNGQSAQEQKVDRPSISHVHNNTLLVY